MNKSRLKSYAPAARRDFIRAVTERANLLGLSDKAIEPVEEKGDVAIIAGRAWPRKVAEQRKGLEQRIEREGFGQVMEAAAYTWFNRFLALRYMELHDYLGHGFRVLSHPGGSHIPEILEQAAKVDLPGLDKEKVVELKLDGNKDAELYRMLLISQCNALHKAMPFLFEKIDDETELLLPENLLHSDSLVRKLVTEIDEEDWKEVEIIGWLYQFYISEKKDQVIGKVVKSEDIPAATQLFTPNWIVKYMVQNSLGRKWLMTYPDSKIKEKMEYYIEPAEQTEEVNRQLKEITPESLNPEEITLMDPASGSGHILVEAYDLFKEIYLERGYRTRDIPSLILEKNLYGLDIDDRAAQMAGFALLMKARADDRRILSGDDPPKMNVMAIQESKGLDADEIADNLPLENSGVEKQDIKDLISLFEHGKTFGSLIIVPDNIAEKLQLTSELIEKQLKSSDLFTKKVANILLPFLKQVQILSKKYECSITNPPYMGRNGMNKDLKIFGDLFYKKYKTDLYSIFVIRLIDMTKKNGNIGLMTPFTWMNLKSFQDYREKLINDYSIASLIQPEYHAFFDSAYVPICAFSMFKTSTDYNATFIDLGDFYGENLQPKKALEAIKNRHCKWRYEARLSYFNKIPGSTIAYSLSKQSLECFSRFEKLSKYADLKQGLITGDNELFLRFWQEISLSNSAITSNENKDIKWYPYQKGGAYRKWYGNNEYVVDWFKNGLDIKNFKNTAGKLRSRPQNTGYYFKEGSSWTSLTVSDLSMRYVPEGYIFDAKGPMCFSKDNSDLFKIIGFCNSKVVNIFLKVLAPSMDYSQGPVGSVPVSLKCCSKVEHNAKSAINLAKEDWDLFEISWDFQLFPWLSPPLKADTTEKSFKNWEAHCTSQIKKMQELETENNRLFIEAYGLQDELSPEVPEDQITLARANREEDVKRLISYSVGCMMGRYSLDEPGLIYAHSGNEGFDQSKYKSFPADDDGIVPIMDMEWFDDDAAVRFENFIKVAWPFPSPRPSPTRGEGGLLEENLKFIAESLSAKKGEAPRDTIRRYFSSSFFKDHLKIYKKRPIYWLFSSGKLKAFECLVYLHRYNESTLSRMRNEYVTPLQGKFTARADYLRNEIDSAASASERNKLQKQLDILRKKQAELKSFDDELRHYADQRIKLDLDDGVKVNYGKFGNLLAEVNAITGKKKK